MTASKDKDPKDTGDDQVGDNAENVVEEQIDDAVDAMEEISDSDQLTEDDAHAAEEAAQDDIEDAEIIEDSGGEPEADEDSSFASDETSEDVDIAEEVVTEPEHVEQPQPVVPAPEKRRGGFFPLLLGGVAAGGIGYGVETYLDSQEQSTDYAALIQEQASEIASLRDQISALPAAPDLTPITNSITETEQTLSASITELSDSVNGRIDGFEDRMTDLEKRPGSDGTLSDEALAAYERELEQLRAEISAQSDSLSSLADQAAADIEAARAESAAQEQAALDAAQAAAARAAINRVALAVETGEPFADLMPELQETVGTVPQELSDVAETGVPSLSDLEKSFDPVARNALEAVRSEDISDGTTSGLGNFLRSQLNVRSTAPREGNDPDAILSRADAAVSDGRLSDALSEVQALPEVGRAEMTDWVAAAQSRLDALNAVSALNETLNEN